ncbi:MAG: LamG domain-containing protein [Planctomycetota bacterium]|jgi:hypothetical protein
MPQLEPVRGLQINWTHPLARGLSGCWLLNEGTGNRVMDSGPFKQYGDFHGGPPLWKPGRCGYSVEFDGADECIDCGPIKFGWDKTNEVSVVALANQAASQVAKCVFGRGAYVRPAVLATQTNGKFYWRVRTNVTVTNITSTSTHATDGSEWVHVAGTWKQNNSRLYVNGVEEASNTTLTGTLSLVDTYSGIGGMYDAGYANVFTGRIGYVLIYNRALSPREIEWLYREPFVMFEHPVTPAFLLATGASVPLAGSVQATSTASARLESICDSPKTEQKWRLDALFNGMTANALKLGTTLSLGWFWVRVGGCSALYRGPGMEQIDFETILAVAEQSACKISPPSYLPHNSNSTHFYVVRRFNHCGYHELTLAAAARVSLDVQGELASSRPNKVFASKAEKAHANKVRLIWFYCPLVQESPPARFNIYHDSGTGQIDYENPIDTVSYKGQKFCTYESDALQAGRYLFAIRAEDPAGIENSSVNGLAIDLDGTGPEVPDILEAETV